MRAGKPPSSLALCSFPTKLASVATSKAIAILRYRQLRISARASQGVPGPPTQEKEAEKATKRRRRGTARRPPKELSRSSSLGLWLEAAGTRLRTRRTQLAGCRYGWAGRALGLLIVDRADDLLAAHQAMYFLAIDGLVLHQRVRDGLELVAVGEQHLARLLLAFGDDAADLLVDQLGGVLRHVLALRDGMAEEDFLLVLVVAQWP